MRAYWRRRIPPIGGIGPSTERGRGGERGRLGERAILLQLLNYTDARIIYYLFILIHDQ